MKAHAKDERARKMVGINYSCTCTCIALLEGGHCCFID